MKKIIPVILLCCFLAPACKTAQSPISETTTETGPETSDAERDGTSIEKAVVVKSVSAEYDWLRKNYPNSRMVKQELIQKSGKHYDKLTVNLPDGGQRDFYFDINSFFGKF